MIKDKTFYILLILFCTGAAFLLICDAFAYTDYDFYPTIINSTNTLQVFPYVYYSVADINQLWNYHHNTSTNQITFVSQLYYGRFNATTSSHSSQSGVDTYDQFYTWMRYYILPTSTAQGYYSLEWKFSNPTYRTDRYYTDLYWDGSNWNIEYVLDPDISPYASTSLAATTTTFKAQEPSAFRQAFGNKLPFYYLYQLADIINSYTATTSATTSYDTINLTIPKTIFINTTTGKTTEIFPTTSTVALVDQNTMFTILPPSAWNIIKNFISVGFVIFTLFGSWEILKKLKFLLT